MAKRKGVQIHDKGLAEAIADIRAVWADARVPHSTRELLEAKWEKVVGRISVLDEKAAKYDAALQKTRDRKARLSTKKATARTP